jgi:phytoene/squalene synthetase
LLCKEARQAIFSIYAFVRLADEIVDTFHDYDKKKLLDKLESEYYEAFKDGISLNPILHAFQKTVKKYNIADEYIQAFLKSMKYDLDKTTYHNDKEKDDYIYGSADVVGLMCLKVFCNGDESEFDKLREPALKLGSAFQKVNFLRDIKNDIENLNRTYFPEIAEGHLNESSKDKIIADIENNFDVALKGIKQLPKNARFAVTAAYYYYRTLLHKIKKTPAEQILASRIRISNITKFFLLLKARIISWF